MTHDEMIAVIAAHRDGKAIDVRRRDISSSWVTAPAPCWNFNDYFYRVKREPRTVWVVYFPDGETRGAYACEVVAKRRLSSQEGATYAKFIEVLE